MHGTSEWPRVNDQRPVALLAREEPLAIHTLAVVVDDVLVSRL